MRTIEAETINPATVITRDEAAPVARAGNYEPTFGGILGTLAALAMSHDVVQPASWKRRAGIPPGADKRASIATATRLLPGAAPHLTRIKDDGRAEALLLARQAWEAGRGSQKSTPPPR